LADGGGCSSNDSVGNEEARAAIPGEVAGDAVDPIAVEAVDEVVITTVRTTFTITAT
jgi:hypothetical protein